MTGREAGDDAPADASGDRPGGACARAASLVALFHPDPAAFGSFREVAAAELPGETRRLLDHESHMTVEMERFHGGPVALRVVAVAAPAGAAAERYAREILLVGPGGDVVQHGIVTVELSAIDPESAVLIRAARTPLGRVLVSSPLLCRVQNVRLLEVSPGPHLRSLFALTGSGATSRLHGRVAEIVLQGRRAIDLLEIAGPRRAM